MNTSVETASARNIGPVDDLPMQPMVTGRRHIIAAGHYLAAEAGARILEAGGNAIDAGVAAGIALGVVHSDQVQFSGVAPILIYLSEENRVVSLAGLGPWPKAATLELFTQDHGGRIPVGLLRTVVPAAPDAWITALANWGTMTFGEVASSAIRYAREGFTVHPVMAEFISRYRENYAKWPENADIWLPGGASPSVGDLLVQSDLARTLQYMADEEEAASTGGRLQGLQAARDAFYLGDIAKRIVSYHADHGGLLSAEDLAAYRTPVEDPLCLAFQGVNVYSCRPWCQGPTLLQALALLDGANLRDIGHNSYPLIGGNAQTLLCRQRALFRRPGRRRGADRYTVIAQLRG
jgi:gamma-glutamyltranspeptidase/glutathione hydrolase